MGSERRKSKRVTVEAVLELKDMEKEGKKKLPVTVVNISSGGIAFKTDVELDMSDHYSTMINLNNCDRFEVVIQILRVTNSDNPDKPNEKTYGCRFIGLNSECEFKLNVFSMFN